MKRPINHQLTLAILVLILCSLACGLVQPKASPTRTPTARVYPTKTLRNTPAPTPQPTKAPAHSGDLIHMWASTGEATSEYGSLSWSALQVSGAPDTPSCSDASTAWTSADPNTRESITAYFMEEPLIPAEINIIESYHPSQVVKVELIDVYAEHNDAVIYQADPMVVTECPYTLSIPVTGIDYPIMGVRVTIDQSVLGLGWNEIDAVELVGYSENGHEAQSVDTSLPKTVWEDVHALPVFPSADYAEYPSDHTLMFGVTSNSRLDVLGYILTELEATGWLLDVDGNGNCLDENRCTSKLDGVDYTDPDNDLWFFIPPDDSSHAYLMLILSEDSGIVYVTMNLE